MNKKSESNSWLKEGARDVLALGSIPFFVLVLARVWILDNPEYFSKFLFSGILFLIFVAIFKINLYSGLSFVILFFTVEHYNDFRFGVLARVMFILLIVSLFYLKYDTKKIILGMAGGVVATVVGYNFVGLVF